MQYIQKSTVQLDMHSEQFRVNSQVQKFGVSKMFECFWNKSLMFSKAAFFIKNTVKTVIWNIIEI